MNRLFNLVDAFSKMLSWIAQFVTVILVISMIYEVVARYVFGAPTIWAFDISYMCTGTLFVLGAAYALKQDAHVRIDFLAQKMPVGLRRKIEGLVFIFLVSPIFAALSKFAIERAWRAWETSEVENVSPWAPLMWPFFAILAIGLVALTLQQIVHGLRVLRGDEDQPFKLEA
jgi:TRAP-type mannitol/chloroaromatic compound transport system permease small subunit